MPADAQPHLALPDGAFVAGALAWLDYDGEDSARAGIVVVASGGSAAVQDDDGAGFALSAAQENGLGDRPAVEARGGAALAGDWERLGCLEPGAAVVLLCTESGLRMLSLAMEEWAGRGFGLRRDDPALVMAQESAQAAARARSYLRSALTQGPGEPPSDKPDGRLEAG